MYLQNNLAYKALRSYIKIKVSQQKTQNGLTYDFLPQSQPEGWQEKKFISHGDGGEKEEGSNVSYPLNHRIDDPFTFSPMVSKNSQETTNNLPMPK